MLGVRDANARIDDAAAIAGRQRIVGRRQRGRNYVHARRHAPERVRGGP
jgi:hypothetical protein